VASGVRHVRGYRRPVSETPPDTAGRRPEPSPEFGPSGYLPERAAKRARKIVLRAPLGLQWVVASLVAGVVVVVAGVLFLQRASDPPPAPWVEIATVDELAATEVVDDLEVLVVTTGGRPRAFARATDVAFCATSNRLEASDGRVWSLTGRGFGGEASLDEHPTLVQDGLLYLDPTRTAAGPPPSDEPVEPACA
jgi:hypothetical protein